MLGDVESWALIPNISIFYTNVSEGSIGFGRNLELLYWIAIHLLEHLWKLSFVFLVVISKVFALRDTQQLIFQIPIIKWYILLKS